MALAMAMIVKFRFVFARQMRRRLAAPGTGSEPTGVDQGLRVDIIIKKCVSNYGALRAIRLITSGRWLPQRAARRPL